MNIIGHLEKLLMNGEITEEEYKKKKAYYVDTLFELYCLDIITEEELKSKLWDKTTENNHLKKQLSDYEKIKSYLGIDKIKELLQTINISMRKKDKADR